MPRLEVIPPISPGPRSCDARVTPVLCQVQLVLGGPETIAATTATSDVTIFHRLKKIFNTCLKVIISSISWNTGN